MSVYKRTALFFVTALLYLLSVALAKNGFTTDLQTALI